VPLSRREILRLGASAAAAALASRCASRAGSVAASPVPSRSSLPRPRRLERVLVDPERIIRRVVGLRPYRPSGFVVRAETVGDKLLVHDYGHGGAGVTLSWGTADLAADLVRESGKTSVAVAVLGCGAVGLAAARVLQRRGFAVTIYAKELPPGTTSSVAGASWYPAFVADRALRTPEWTAQFERAARTAHREFQGLVGDDYGVRWREEYFVADQPDQELGDWGMHDLFPQRRTLSAAESPFAARHVTVDNLMFIEPPVYLRALMRDFELAGGRIVVRAFVGPSELAALPESVVVNCTGLGARELFGDTELTPIKGQLTVLLPQPEVDYAVLTPDLYMFPRRDGIQLGGTHERGVETLEPDLDAERRIVAGHRAIFDAMRDPYSARAAGFSAPRTP
jgi:D-amino-acid oxidase